MGSTTKSVDVEQFRMHITELMKVNYPDSNPMETFEDLFVLFERLGYGYGYTITEHVIFNLLSYGDAYMWRCGKEGYEDKIIKMIFVERRKSRFLLRGKGAAYITGNFSTSMEWMIIDSAQEAFDKYEDFDARPFLIL